MRIEQGECGSLYKGTTTINGAKKSVELVQSSVFLYDENGQKVTSLTIANQGTYDLDLVNKTIVFTPLKTFYGPATPVRVGGWIKMESRL